MFRCNTIIIFYHFWIEKIHNLIHDAKYERRLISVQNLLIDKNSRKPAFSARHRYLCPEVFPLSSFLEVALCGAVDGAVDGAAAVGDALAF